VGIGEHKDEIAWDISDVALLASAEACGSPAAPCGESSDNSLEVCAPTFSSPRLMVTEAWP